MIDTSNVVIISPELLLNIGKELNSQSEIIQTNLEKISKLLDNTSELYNDEQVKALYAKIKDQTEKINKLREAMTSFGGVLENVGNQWNALKESGELDKIIQELEAE